MPTPATKAVILPVGLLPDLRAGGAVVDLGVGQVGELVGPPGPGDLAGQAVGHAVVALGRVGRDRGRRDHDLGAVGLEQADLLAAHLVGQDEDAAVALDRRRHGQADAGVAGGGLDDRAARPQPAPPLGLVDHGHADAVLDAAARIERLELDQDPRRHTLAQPMQRDQRRSADRVEDGLADPCRRRAADRVSVGCALSPWSTRCVLVRMRASPPMGPLQDGSLAVWTESSMLYCDLSV